MPGICKPSFPHQKTWVIDEPGGVPLKRESSELPIQRCMQAEAIGSAHRVSRNTSSLSLAPKGGRVCLSQLPSLGTAERRWLLAYLPSSPQPLRTPRWLCPIRPAQSPAKMEHTLGHMTSVCWKRSPSKEREVILQNFSSLGSASFARKVWEGGRAPSAELLSQGPRETQRRQG